MDELSDEMLKIIDLIKAGQVELVEQLLIGNPEICSDSSNENTTKIYLTIFKDSPDLRTTRSNWYDGMQIGYDIKDWLIYWVNWNKDYNQ